MSDKSKLTVNSIHVHVGKNINALFARKDAISIRFSVQISVEKPNKSEGEGCWVTIAGDHDRVIEAQTYVKCLCAPEDVGAVKYPGELHGYLSDRQIVYSLEKQYKVIIELKDGEREDDPGEAIVKGASLDVALALSAIEDMVANCLRDSDTSTGSSASHSYSHETSNKLNSTLIGISDKGGIQLEKEEVAHYSDVMKKLVLSWASADNDAQEIVNIEDSEDSNSDSDNGNDRTIVTSSVPAGFATSTPLVRREFTTSTPLVVRPEPSTSTVKVEKISSQPLPNRPVASRRQGKVYVDLTSSQTAKKVTVVDSDDDDDEEMPIKRNGRRYNSQNSWDMTLTEGSSRSQSSSSTTTTRSTHHDNANSPTTQAEKDISTITLDDDTSLSDITLKTPSVGSYDAKVTRLVGIGSSKGYDEIEMAQALSLCEDSELDEQTFLSSLTQIRGGEPVVNAAKDKSPQFVTPVPKKSEETAAHPKPAARRNVALESINKRQIHPSSPTSKAVMPTEKRVKTVPDSSGDIVVIPHTAAEPRSLQLSPPRHDAPQQQSKPAAPSQLQQLQQIRAQRSQQYSVAQPLKTQQGFNYVQPTASTSSYSDPIKSIHNQPPPASSYSQPSTSNIHQLHTSEYTMSSQPGQRQQQPTPNFSQLPPPLPQGRPDLPPLPAAPALTNRGPPKTRMVVLDGSNIAFSHGKKYHGYEKTFSAEGILLAVNYLRRTYDATSENVKVIVPNFRRRDRLTRDAHLLDQMENSQYLVFSPCKTMPGGQKIVPYDDRFILDLAVVTDGVVISNDKYADLITEQNGKYRDVISNRVIMYMFVGDMFMIPEDPMGRHGPKLEQLLRPRGFQGQPAIPTQPTVTRYQHPPPAHPQQQQPSYPNQNRFSSLPNNAPDRFSTPAQKRSAAETDQLCATLLDMFPGKRERIRSLLNRHPHEKHAEMFVEQLIME